MHPGMKRPLLPFPTLLVTASLLTGLSAAENRFHICRDGCAHLMPAASGDKPGRKYARDRLIDIDHLTLDVTPDFAKRTVSGTATLTFSPIAKPLAELELDAVDLNVASVESTPPAASWRLTEEKLVITFAQPLAAGAAGRVLVRYSAQPQERGLYFRTPEMGYPQGDTQVWSQGEAELHHFWFPCYDYPNERFTSEVTCHVPDGMVVVSNGSLVEQTKDAAGLNAWHWSQKQPLPNYLLALAAGYFHKEEDSLGTLPLRLWAPPSRAPLAKLAFQDTRKIIDFYQKETGHPFPWDKYDQVYCYDFVAGGMENASATFMTENALTGPETGTLHNVRGLDAHEAAHQWFGDLVTCRDWAHLWLNEGFASYYADLYEEQSQGRDGFHAALWKEAWRVLDTPDTKPVVWRDYRDAMEQFDYRAYPKGAWTLHMLRSQLGPDLYRKAIKTYLDRHQNTVVTTEDLQDVLEEVSGRSFDQFFDQWIYHGGTPQLKVDYAWDAAAGLAKLSIRQTQKVSEAVPLFRFPLPVQFRVKGEKDTRLVTIEVSKDTEDFYFPLPAEPELLRLDSDYTVLAKIDFQPPAALFKAQLTSDLTGRLLAIRQLAEKKDAESATQLKDLLAADPHWLPRVEAAKALKRMGTDQARTALLGQMVQPDDRVRREVIDALTGFWHPDVTAALDLASTTEKNPEILAALVTTWGARGGEPAIASSLRGHLASSTPGGNPVAVAALAALRGQDDPAVIPDIIARLKGNPLDFDTGDFGRALDTLAFLARKQEHPDAVRTFIAGHLTHPKQALRAAAARALGTLNDPRSIPLLEPLARVRMPHLDPVREAADKAVALLTAQKPVSAELPEVYKRLEEMKKKTEALEKDLETLKKKGEAKKP